MGYKITQRLYLCGAAVFAALFLLGGVMFVRQVMDQRQSAEKFEKIASLVEEDSEKTGDTDADERTEASEETEEVISAAEKYAAVYAQNPDFIGWLTIPGTLIDYPVMLSPDEPDFYLKHGFDRSYSSYGVPYMQENCDSELSDNLIIYGHHMKDGSMFAGLCKYESEDFYREHRTFTFDTLSEYGEYEIVAVFKTVAYSENGFKYYQFVNAENEEDFDEFIAECKSLALYDTGVTAEYGDRLLTLSTCEYSRTNGRMVVVAKRVEKPLSEVEDDA